MPKPDNGSMLNGRKVLSENNQVIGQFNEGVEDGVSHRIEFDYKPTYIKNISVIWLLVAGRGSFAEIYSAITMRRATIL